MVLHNMVGLVWCGTVKSFTTVMYDMICYDMALHGMVWDGNIIYDKELFGYATMNLLYSIDGMLLYCTVQFGVWYSTVW